MCANIKMNKQLWVCLAVTLALTGVVVGLTIQLKKKADSKSKSMDLESMQSVSNAIYATSLLLWPVIYLITAVSYTHLTLPTNSLV